MDIQCKYQLPDTKRTRTINEIIWHFYSAGGSKLEEEEVAPSDMFEMNTPPGTPRD